MELPDLIGMDGHFVAVRKHGAWVIIDEDGAPKWEEAGWAKLSREMGRHWVPVSAEEVRRMVMCLNREEHRKMLHFEAYRKRVRDFYRRERKLEKAIESIANAMRW